MTDRDHLEHPELVAYIDGELDEKRAAEIGQHLAGCATCSAEYNRLDNLSARIRTFLAAPPLDSGAATRAELLARWAPQSAPNRTSSAGNVMRRFGWGMALAASLATALLFVPHRSRVVAPAVNPILSQKAPMQTASLDVNGESFVALPYSNPDLPLNAPRIVEMQVPVSSLTAAGIAVEAGPNGSPDRTVRANVLLGMDGQPLGLHVLAAD